MSHKKKKDQKITLPGNDTVFTVWLFEGVFRVFYHCDLEQEKVIQSSLPETNLKAQVRLNTSVSSCTSGRKVHLHKHTHTHTHNLSSDKWLQMGVLGQGCVRDLLGPVGCSPASVQAAVGCPGARWV